MSRLSNAHKQICLTSICLLGTPAKDESEENASVLDDGHLSLSTQINLSRRSGDNIMNVRFAFNEVIGPNNLIAIFFTCNMSVVAGLFCCCVDLISTIETLAKIVMTEM